MCRTLDNIWIISMELLHILTTQFDSCNCGAGHGWFCSFLASLMMMVSSFYHGIIDGIIPGSTWQWWRSEAPRWGLLLPSLNRQDHAKVIDSFCFCCHKIILWDDVHVQKIEKSLIFAVHRGEKNSGEVALFTCTWTPGSIIHPSCCSYSLTQS